MSALARPTPAVVRRARTGIPNSAVGQVSAAGAVLGAAVVALVASRPAAGAPWPAVLPALVGFLHLAGAMAVRATWPGNRMAVLLAAGALAWMAAGLAGTAVPPLKAIGLVAAAVPLAVAVHLLQAFPSGRPLSRSTVLAAYVVALVLEAPAHLFERGTPLTIADQPALARAGSWLAAAAGLAVLAATAWALERRRRHAPWARRAALAGAPAYALAAVLFAALSAELARGDLVGGGTALVVAQSAALATVPIALLLAALRAGLGPTGELAELGAWLDADDDRRTSLAEALAEWLGDPSLEVLYWVPELAAHVDAAGREVALPAPGADRAAVEVSLGDRRVGAIVYDGALIARPNLLRAAGRVVALALDHERLTGELLASQERLRQSRARIVEAADSERRRLARDLHDGLQARLLLLAMEADRLRAEAIVGGEASGAAASLHSGLHAAITELRELVHGVMPAALTERGLRAATQELAYRLPITVELDVGTDELELPPAAESTGYFVVSEALANAVKHSGATQVVVRLGCTDGTLRIEVHDDGVGGAGVVGGGGVRGLADRVEALGGSIAIDSPPAGGTRVLVELPIDR